MEGPDLGRDPPKNGMTHSEPSPLEALALLSISLLLFWGGAALLQSQRIVLLYSVLPLASFLAPAVAWAELRGVLPLAFPSRRLTRAGLTSAVGLVLGGSLLALACAGLFSGLPAAGKEEDALRAFLMGVNPINRIFLFALLPALCEEMLFRGAVLVCLRRWGPVRACVASGVLFGAFHGSLIRFLPVALLGTALAVVVWRTGNIWLAVAGHALHNSLILMALGFDGTSAPLPVGTLAAMASTGLALIAFGLFSRGGRPASGVDQFDRNA
jgi:sodium transport system permease protein